MNISYVDFSKFLENQGITKSKYKFLENFSKCNQLLTIREFLTGFIKSSDKNNLSKQIFKKYVDYDDVHIKNIFKKLNLIKIRMNKNIKIKYLHLWLKKCFIIDNNFISLRNKNKLNLNSKNRLYDDYKYRNNYLHILKIISSIKEGEKSPFKPKVNKNVFITINTTSNNNNDDLNFNNLSKNNKFKTINSTPKTKNKISYNIVNDYLKREPKGMFSYKPKISKLNQLRIKDDYFNNPYIYPNNFYENNYLKNKYNENNKSNSRFQHKSLLSNRINETDPNKNNVIYRKFRNPISSTSLANANTNLITDTLNKSDKFNSNNNNNNNNYFGTINSINSFQDNKNYNKFTITNFEEAYFNDKKNIDDLYVTKENLLLKSNYPQYNRIMLQNISDRQLLKKADALMQPDESIKRFLTIYEKQKNLNKKNY